MATSIRGFISYSWRDKPLARRLARRLRHAGIDVFLDENHLGPGMPLPDSLKREIDGSTHVFVVWTCSAASSAWVAQEIEYTTSVDSEPMLIPLLFAPPGNNSVITNTTGIGFSETHRFERAFQQLLSAIDLVRPAPSREELTADLTATLVETPAIAGVFRSPIDRVAAGEDVLDIQLRETLTPDDPSAIAAREELLANARDAFESWKPESVFIHSLPAPKDPEFHALDFALWCAAGIALRKTDELRPMQAPELKTFPGIFAKVLGATGAGFEAIVSLLDRFPGLGTDAMRELMTTAQVCDGSLATTVALYDTVFHMVAEDSARDQLMPFSCAANFFFHNHGRLTEPQKQTFIRLVDINGNGPYPGGPLDMLGALYTDAVFSEEALDRILYWTENGYFDGTDSLKRSDMPYMLYGFVAGLIEQDAPAAHIRRLLAAASHRIRRHFRSSQDERVLLALTWIAHANRLPVAARRSIERGFEEGVYSTEFERWQHAGLVGPLARELVSAVVHQPHRESAVKAMIREELRKAELPEPLL